MQALRALPGSRSVLHNAVNRLARASWNTPATRANVVLPDRAGNGDPWDGRGGYYRLHRPVQILSARLRLRRCGTVSRRA